MSFGNCSCCQHSLDTLTLFVVHVCCYFGLAQYPGGVGFTACVSVPDLVNLGEHHIILFDSEITNFGTAYHSKTGVFQAPLKGKVLILVPEKEICITGVKQ